MAQRLVRRICDGCKEAYTPDEEILMELGPDAERVRGASFYYGKGCEACHHTGYSGRTGIFEVMTVDGDVRRAILAGGSSEDVRKAALAAGMQTLRERGLAAVTAGLTTIEEVLRETHV